MFSKEKNENGREYKAIVFDIDGTLYSNRLMLLSAPYVYIRNILWLFRFSRMRKDLREYLSNHQPEALNKEAGELFFKKSIEIFAENLGVSEREAWILLKKHIYDAWIEAVGHTPLRLGMRHLLGELKRNGYKLAVLSDFQSQQKISQWGLDGYFDQIVCAEDFGILKPNKEIFHMTSELLVCKPEEVVFVGNHLHYDGIGAANANMKSLLFYKKKIKRSLAQTYEIHTFHSILGLKQKLRSLNIKI